MEEFELPSDAPKPRLCHLIKRSDFVGYGFNLHAERNKLGQFVGKVDIGSPALLAGMREHDRIVEVNGVNIGNENHKQVVERIRTNPNEAQLLVVDRQTDEYYKERKIVIKGSLSNVSYKKTPMTDEINSHEISGLATESAKSSYQEIEEDPNYATVAHSLPPPPPEIPAPPSPAEDFPPDIPAKCDTEEFPLPPEPVVENQDHSPRANNLATATPITPPQERDDVQTHIEISGHRELPLNDSMTPPPPYDSAGAVTPEASPHSSPSSGPQFSTAQFSERDSPKSATSGSSAAAMTNNNLPRDGDPVFTLSAADMRARLKAKKRMDPRENEAPGMKFKEKYELFQKL